MANNNAARYANQYTGPEERARLFAKGSDPLSSLGSNNLNRPEAENASVGANNYLTLGFDKFRKNFTAGFKAGRLRNVDPSAMLNTARINQATMNLEQLQQQLNHAKNAQQHKNQYDPIYYNQINANVNIMSKHINSKLKALDKLKGDKNAAIQKVALKKLESKVSMFNRFLNTMKKGTRKVASVFSRGNSGTRKNVMAKASKALNSLQNMGSISESISRIAKAIEDCCEDDTGRSVAPSKLDNNNGGNNGGEEPGAGPGSGGNNNGRGVRVPGNENNGWNAAREAAGRRAAENNGAANENNGWNAAREAAGRRAGENNNGGAGNEEAGGAGGENNANRNEEPNMPNVRPRAPNEADYRELDLEPGATLAEVRRAFRRLAAIHHPNRGGNTARMQRINGAYGKITAYLEYFERHPNERPENREPEPEVPEGNLGYGENNNGIRNGNVSLRGFFGNNNFENEAPAAGRRAEAGVGNNNNWNAAREAAARRVNANNLNNGAGAGENANAAYMRAFNEGQRRRAAAANEANAERRRRAQANLNRLEREEAEEAAEEARRAAVNAARAEQEARRRANVNRGAGGLNNFEPGGRIPNRFFNEEEAGGAAAAAPENNGNRPALAAGAAAAAGLNNFEPGGRIPNRFFNEEEDGEVAAVNANAARALEDARVANEAAARAAAAAANEARQNRNGRGAGPRGLAAGAAQAAGLAENANLVAAEAANRAARVEAEVARQNAIRARRAANKNAAANEANAVSPSGLFSNNNFEPAEEAAVAAEEAGVEAAGANAAAARANGIAAAAPGNNGAAAAAARANEEAAAANAAAARAAAVAAEQARQNAIRAQRAANKNAANANANTVRPGGLFGNNNNFEPVAAEEEAGGAAAGVVNNNANSVQFNQANSLAALERLPENSRRAGRLNLNKPPNAPKQISSIANLTADERARYNAMRNLNDSISESNALGMLQKNRNMSRNKPFEFKTPGGKAATATLNRIAKTRGKKRGRKSNRKSRKN